MDYTEEIQAYRQEKDEYLKNSPRSPLSLGVQQKFDGLEYYPISEDYRFELILHENPSPEEIIMDTSDGQSRQYYDIGYLEFEVQGQSAQIHIYQSSRNPDHYFVPFRDETSGKETYGAGRYLDIEKVAGKFQLDFNKSYNPFCAYSDAYSCPLPPMDNWLDLPIKAGEKSFKK